MTSPNAGPARSTADRRLLALHLGLGLGAGLGWIGCADREPVPTGIESGTGALLADGGPPSENRLDLAGARLRLLTDDPNQDYITWSDQPWLRYSTLTESSGFSLIVTNEGTAPARQLELLVAVPADLPADGWSVTIGDPGTVLTGAGDFDRTELNESSYPRIAHWIYAPQGNARFAIIEGPALLAAGESWVLPVQLFRGSTPGFQVHFDAASRRLYCSPLSDVTAVPPLGDGEGSSGPRGDGRAG